MVPAEAAHRGEAREDVLATALDCLDHVAIPARDIPGTIRWYRERFRCEVLYEDPTWALLGFDNVRLALVTPGQHPPHVCFLHEEAERFGPLKTHRDGTRSTYVEDPEGNAVEVMRT